MHHLKKFIAAIFCVCSIQYISAQSNYVTHTLKQGESLSALAKEYNTSVGDIMRMNGMHADTKLVYGSQIKIPSTQKQLVTAKKETAVVTTPTIVPAPSNATTHTIAQGETLYSISKSYNTTVAQIKAWNNLTDDNVKLGTTLIVGAANTAVKNTPASGQKQKTEIVAAPLAQKEPVVETKPGNDLATVTGNATTNIQPEMQPGNSMSSAVVASEISNYSGVGFFAPQFKEKKSKKMQTVSGISKTFKTASGWTDGKFYILANGIEPGTIVKITAENGAAVYAKVLWNMGDLKENAGINFRVSNATAAALHVDESSFNVNVNF